jgi:hypothetical protein
MTVFVLMRNDGSCREQPDMRLIGVYATLELAEHGRADSLITRRPAGWSERDYDISEEYVHGGPEEP